MMKDYEVNECFELLLAIVQMPDEELGNAYKQLRGLLERVCRSCMTDEHLQMTDLSARISWISARFELSTGEQNRLHTFRLTSNHILNHREEATRDKLLRDVKTITFFLKKITGADVPDSLYRLLPKTDATFHAAPKPNRKIDRLRVCYLYKDEHYLYVTPLDEVAEQPLRVRYNIADVNDEFAETVEELWPHAQLNLLDISIYEEADILTPSFIVLEPDYLIDISSLAECFKDYGSHPGNYLLARLQPIENAMPILLENIVNLFLDEWIYAKEEPDYMSCMKKAFARYPIELAACTDLQSSEKEREFAQACKNHFDNLRITVKDQFHDPGYKLDKSDAVLEPSYICEPLGLQGRLDYMQRDMSSFIEMKSGKGEEYIIRGKVLPKENHKVQMLLYQAVLQYSMGMNHNHVKAFLLYTRYPMLYPSRTSWAQVRRAINLRNLIVTEEYGVQLRNNISYTAERLSQLRPDVLKEKAVSDFFWKKYLLPSLSVFPDSMAQLTSLEQNYFYALYNFITKELYTSKSGDVDYDGRRGASALWLSTLDEKMDAGEIIHDLRIIENHATDEHKANIIFSMPALMNDDAILPNFRLGDAIVLYERNSDEDNVSNKMVFKGNIEAMTSESIKIRLRATQQNVAVLPAESVYAIEHDSMDTAFRTMYHGLWTFMKANQDRRDLLLNQRTPGFDESYIPAIQKTDDDFERIALKAQAAQDYFLLIGPPGTGKTSRALKRMVEKFYFEQESQIILLSYTNRAVDEICKSLSSISPSVDYIRVGSELSCDPAYRDHLLENEMKRCQRRSEVAQRIKDCRIIIGTVAAISGKPELFRLKRFDVAIIDEATQILEPQLLGILCAQTPTGDNAIGKFVMIGDHKQLPAVVLQSATHAEVYDEELRQIGLSNLKDSLFERLYRSLRLSESDLSSKVCDMLCRQGRMHPDVALFANEAFYGGQLDAVGLPHQIENTDLYKRTSFYPSEPEPVGGSVKINTSEAQLAAQLALQVYEREMQLDGFDPMTSLGIITPYRSQIVLIKREIEKLGIAPLNEIIIDTVERFQGSERDTIIYSFCINSAYQLQFLANMTIDDGVEVDRKLNVALTRARKQMMILGVPHLLKLNPIYKRLIKWLLE